jgi:Ca-activated chloride channel family protein
LDEPDRQTSDNFRFSAAVAGFGMLLRDSEFKGSMTYNSVLSLARGAKGRDDDGYRAEFIRLVELSDSGLKSDSE